jgi:hypothetical protein
MARDYLAIQGSAVPSERVFSGGSITATRRRNRLTTQIFAALQRLKDAYRDGRLSAAAEAWEHIPASFLDEVDLSEVETDVDL